MCLSLPYCSNDIDRSNKKKGGICINTLFERERGGGEEKPHFHVSKTPFSGSIHLIRLIGAIQVEQATLWVNLTR